MALLSNALASQSDSHNNNREIEKLLKQIADLEEEKRQDAHEVIEKLLNLSAISRSTKYSCTKHMVVLEAEILSDVVVVD